MINKNRHIEVHNEKFPLLKDLHSYQDEIQEKISCINYFQNVFLMMKYRDYNKQLSDYIIEILKQKNLIGVRADMRDWMITGDSILNPLAVLYCCQYGIALFDRPDDGQFYGPNVAYELGIMHSQHKKCLILIHDDIKDKKPFDILGKMHKVYKEQLDVKDLINDWIEENRVITDISSKVERHNIAIGIVKHENKFLMTQRKIKENNLMWSFPAVQLKPNHAPETLLTKEILAETNIRVKPIFLMGERAHPNIPTYAYYWFCEYIEGEIENRDINENENVKWLTSDEALSLITSDIYPKLKDLLINSK